MNGFYLTQHAVLNKISLRHQNGFLVFFPLTASKIIHSFPPLQYNYIIQLIELLILFISICWFSVENRESCRESMWKVEGRFLEKFPKLYTLFSTSGQHSRVCAEIVQNLITPVLRC
jgi:hypothetical protein